MAVSSLIVAVRATGQAALRGLSNGFRQLNTDVRQAAANMRVAWGRMTSAFIARGGLTGAIRRLPAQFRQLARSVSSATRALFGYIVASRAAQAASDALGRALPGIAMLGTKLVIVAAAIVPLVGIIGNLLGAIQLIAPVVGVAALMFGTLKLATKGFGDALKAGLEGDVEALDKALEKLSPSARSAVLTLVDLRNEWQRTQKAVQQNFFAGFREDVIGLSRAFQPLAEKWLPRIATSFADARKAVADVFTSFAKGTGGEAVFRNLSRAIDDILRSLGPLSQAFTDVLEVASPRFQALTSDAATLADKFAAWIREMKESGKLGEWLDEALATLGKLKEIGGNLVGIFKGLFKAGEDDGQNFLDKLVEITEKFEEFTNSAKGQQLLNFFGLLINVMVASVPVWNVLLHIVAFGIGQFKVMGMVGVAIWDGIKTALSAFVGVAFNAFGLFLSAASKAFGWIPGIGPKLRQAEADFRKFAQDVNNQINGIQKTVTITVRARLVGDSLLSGAQLSGNYSSGVGGRASGGPVAAGQTVWVGERGKELVTFGGNGYVHDAATSRGMMAGGSRGGGTVLAVQPVVAAGTDSMVAAMLNKMIRTGLLSWVVVNNRIKPA